MFQIITKFKNPYFSGHTKNRFFIDKMLYSEFSARMLFVNQSQLILEILLLVFEFFLLKCTNRLIIVNCKALFTVLFG